MPTKTTSDSKSPTPRPTRAAKPKAKAVAAEPASVVEPTPVVEPAIEPAPAEVTASPAPAAPAKAARAKPSRAIEQRAKMARRASVMLKFVSDPTRLRVILLLSEDEHHVGALCEQLGQSQPAVSHHLALLRHGGVISPRRLGKNNFYSLSPSGTELARMVKLLLDAS